MGLKNMLKKDGHRPSDDIPPSYPASDKTNIDEELGQNTNIQTGWTGDGYAGAVEYTNREGENYRTLGKWRACVILITIEGKMIRGWTCENTC